MKIAAFFAHGPSVRMRSRSKYFPLSFRAFLDSSVHSPRRIRLYNLHSNRTCLTVWSPCLQIASTLPNPGDFPLEQKFVKSDFSCAHLYHQRAQLFCETQMQFDYAPPRWGFEFMQRATSSFSGPFLFPFFQGTWYVRYAWGVWYVLRYIISEPVRDSDRGTSWVRPKLVTENSDNTIHEPDPLLLPTYSCNLCFKF